MQLKLVQNNYSIFNEEKNSNDEKAPSTAPVYQGDVFIIMWPSNRSGGTYSALRKSEEGKNNYLKTLDFMGVNMSKVRVIKQSKPWVPIKGEKNKKTKDKKEKK